jgi:hypothetical protein
VALYCKVDALAWGRHIQYIPPENIRQALKFLFWANLPYNLVHIFGKTTIALILIRLPMNRAWNWFLYGLLTILALILVGTTVQNFAMCRPNSAVFDYCLLGTGSSWSISTVLTLDYFWGGKSLPSVCFQEVKRGTYNGLPANETIFL